MDGYCPDDSVISFVFRARDDLFYWANSPLLFLSQGNFSIHFRLTLSAEISCILSNFALSISLSLSPNVTPPILSSFLPSPKKRPRSPFCRDAMREACPSPKS